jgi:hypothetical protein
VVTICTTCFNTECRGRMVNPPASYKGGPGHRLSWGFSRFFPVPPSRDSTFTSGHDRFHFVTFIRRYTVYAAEKSYLNEPQTNLTIIYSAFCSAGTFMGFVRLSQKTAIVFLNAINQIVFGMETRCFLWVRDYTFKYQQSRYTPWWHFGGRGGIAPTHSWHRH